MADSFRVTPTAAPYTRKLAPTTHLAQSRAFVVAHTHADERARMRTPSSTHEPPTHALTLTLEVVVAADSIDARPQQIPADRTSRLLDLPRAHPAAPAGTLHPPNARRGHWPQRFKQGRVTRLSRPARSVRSGWLASAYLGSRKPPNPIGATKGCLTIGIADALVSAMLWRKHRWRKHRWRKHRWRKHRWRSSQLAPVRVANAQ